MAYKQYFAKERQFTSKNSSVIVFVHSTWSWWDKSFRDLSQAVVELWPYIHKLTTDGRTDKHDVYRTITFNKSCNVLKVNPSGKKKQTKKSNNNKKQQQTVPNVCQTRRPWRTQTLFQFSTSPSPFVGKTENATFSHSVKKSIHLKKGKPKSPGKATSRSRSQPLTPGGRERCIANKQRHDKHKDQFPLPQARWSNW